MADIRDTILADGSTPYVTVVILEETPSLRAAMRGRGPRVAALRTRGALLYLAQEQLIEIVAAPSDHELRQ